MNIVQIQLANTENNTEKNHKAIKLVFGEMIEKAFELGIWDNSIAAIIITDDFSNEIENQAKKWNIKVNISREKGYSVASKILCNYYIENRQYHIYFQFNLLLYNPSSLLEIFLGQILRISADQLFPSILPEKDLEINIKSLDDYIKYACVQWCKSKYVKDALMSFHIDLMPPMDHKSILIAFKRKLKKYLFEYNSDDLDNDERIKIFWYNYFESIETLFLRIVENETSDSRLQIASNEPCRALLYNVVSAIQNLTRKCLKDKDFDTHQVKETVKLFSDHFGVFLENESEGGFGILLTKNPKDYFVGELVETEPRIVCFLDILGFSELIKRYDDDITSTLLQDIQESFKIATKTLKEAVNQQDKDLLKHLKYYSFSDNICISLPFFETKHDFIKNFNLLCIYTRGFQLIMMSKGIFMRGGISTGSYFSDENLIFSIGLVNAYKLESKNAIYPRVVIDDLIINRLLRYGLAEMSKFGLGKVIVFDSNNIAFLNHFGLMETSILQLSSALENSDIKSDEIDDPLFRTIGGFMKRIENFTTTLLKSLEVSEKKQLQEIKMKVAENILLHLDNDRVAQKYQWLYEFLLWIENEKMNKLNFQFISDRLNK